MPADTRRVADLAAWRQRRAFQQLVRHGVPIYVAELGRTLLALHFFAGRRAV